MAKGDEKNERTKQEAEEVVKAEEDERTKQEDEEVVKDEKNDKDDKEKAKKDRGDEIISEEKKKTFQGELEFLAKKKNQPISDDSKTHIEKYEQEIRDYINDGNKKPTYKKFGGANI
jgi:hypothetical protein